jgi:hypothetical protein
MSEKTRNDLPAKDKIINQELNNSRTELIRGQLELKFLEEYLKTMKADQEKDGTNVVSNSYFLSIADVEGNILRLTEANKYFLARKEYYQNLRDKSIEKKNRKVVEKAMGDYEKCPDKLVISGNKVLGSDNNVIATEKKK